MNTRNRSMSIFCLYLSQIVEDMYSTLTSFYIFFHVEISFLKTLDLTQTFSMIKQCFLSSFWANLAWPCCLTGCLRRVGRLSDCWRKRFRYRHHLNRPSSGSGRRWALSSWCSSQVTWARCVLIQFTKILRFSYFLPELSFETNKKDS